MIDNPEQPITPKVESEKQDFNARIEIEFQKYLETIPNERRASFESLDLKSKIIKLTNNFHFWWPGGMYRDYLEKIKRETSDSSSYSLDQKLVNDLDKAILEGGYQKIADSLKENFFEKMTIRERSMETMLAIGDVFLRMLDTGYDREKLRK